MTEYTLVLVSTKMKCFQVIQRRYKFPNTQMEKKWEVWILVDIEEFYYQNKSCNIPIKTGLTLFDNLLKIHLITKKVILWPLDIIITLTMISSLSYLHFPWIKPCCQLFISSATVKNFSMNPNFLSRSHFYVCLWLNSTTI